MIEEQKEENKVEENTGMDYNDLLYDFGDHLK